MTTAAHLPAATTATTTAWGNADPLDVALARIASETTATSVELAIGARPVADPDSALDAHRGRFTYIGHHTLPLGRGVNLRPGIGEEDRIVDACVRFGLSRYSAHPPHLKHATVGEFYDWAASYHERLGEVGVAFSVETMYVPIAAREVASSGGYHLARPGEVQQFCEWASSRGWATPLLADASHLHIGWCQGEWTEEQIVEVLGSPFVAEVHLSENDGRTDSHRPLTATHPVSRWLAGVRAPVVVDEGRRRGTRSLGRGVSDPSVRREPTP